jgi:hypothetical protein
MKLIVDATNAEHAHFVVVHPAPAASGGAISMVLDCALSVIHGHVVGTLATIARGTPPTADEANI